MPRVGVLTPEGSITAKRLRVELQKLGWIEGRSLRLDIRFGSDDTQTGVFAADLVRLAPDVIVTDYLVALRALQQQTKAIPIVLIGTGDPVRRNGEESCAPRGQRHRVRQRVRLARRQVAGIAQRGGPERQAGLVPVRGGFKLSAFGRGGRTIIGGASCSDCGQRCQRREGGDRSLRSRAEWRPDSNPGC
jgi:hypothetical protein